MSRPSAWQSALLLVPVLLTVARAQPSPASPAPPRLVGLVTGASAGGPSMALVACPQDGAGASAHLVVAGDSICDWLVTAIDATGVDVQWPATATHQRLALPDDVRRPAPPAGAVSADSPAVDSLPAPTVTQKDGVVHIVIAPAVLEGYLANLPALLTSATIAPRPLTRDTAGGPATVFEVVNIRGGSLLEQLGVRAGDVVLDVNGAPLRDATGMLTLLADLKDARHATVGVRRGLTRLEFVVDVR